MCKNISLSGLSEKTYLQGGEQLATRKPNITIDVTHKNSTIVLIQKEYTVRKRHISVVTLTCQSNTVVFHKYYKDQSDNRLLRMDLSSLTTKM